MMTSSPPIPEISSLPPRPKIRSGPSVPKIRSLPSVPRRSGTHAGGHANRRCELARGHGCSCWPPCAIVVLVLVELDGGRVVEELVEVT